MPIIVPVFGFKSYEGLVRRNHAIRVFLFLENLTNLLVDFLGFIHFFIGQMLASLLKQFNNLPIVEDKIDVSHFGLVFFRRFFYDCNQF